MRERKTKSKADNSLCGSTGVGQGNHEGACRTEGEEALKELRG
jgi:hypothetical protein